MQHWSNQLRNALAQRDLLSSDHFQFRDTSTWAWTVGHFLGAGIVILLSYAWFFSGSVQAAFDDLSGRASPSQSLTDDVHWTNASNSLAQVLFTLVILAAVFYWIRPRFEATPPPARMRRAGIVAIIYTMALMVFSWSVPVVNGWFGQDHSYPRSPDDSTAAVADAFTHSVCAGFSEELIITVIPILLLRAVNTPWPVIVPLLLIERVLFHIYYGPGSITVIIWAGLSILLYRYTQSATGLVLAHVVYDLYCDVSVYFGDHPATLVLETALLIYGLMVMAGHITATGTRYQTDPA